MNKKQRLHLAEYINSAVAEYVYDSDCGNDFNVIAEIACKNGWSSTDVKPKQAQSPGWINVQDKLPRNANFVLVCRECLGEKWPSLAAYVRDGDVRHWYDQGGFDIDDVTHWMPIVLPK